MVFGISLCLLCSPWQPGTGRAGWAQNCVPKGWSQPASGCRAVVNNCSSDTCCLDRGLGSLVSYVSCSAGLGSESGWSAKTWLNLARRSSSAALLHPLWITSFQIVWGQWTPRKTMRKAGIYIYIYVTVVWGSWALSPCWHGESWDMQLVPITPKCFTVHQITALNI